MNKKTIIALSFCATVITLPVNANKNASKATLPQQCQKLFSETNRLIRDAARQPGTHDTQVKKMQTKLSETQKQIAKLDQATQQKSCDQGLIALNNMKKRH